MAGEETSSMANSSKGRKSASHAEDSRFDSSIGHQSPSAEGFRKNADDKARIG